MFDRTTHGTCRPTGPAGYSLPELMMVLVMIALTATMSAVVWQTSQRRASVTSAAESTRTALYQARTLSIFRGVNHFVAIDPAGHKVEIYEDSNAPIGVFDNGDTRVSSELWPGNVKLELPGTPSPFPSPVGGASLTDPWSLPLPDSSARWGANLRGVMTTPQGTFLSAEAVPAPIGEGSIVLTDFAHEGISSVVIEGRTGTIRLFRMSDGTWGEL